MAKMARIFASTSILLCTVFATGCGSISRTGYLIANPSLTLAGTPGEYFRQYLVKHHAECRELKVGPYVDPHSSPRSSTRADTSCDLLLLKPWEPGGSPQSEAAHAIKLPGPHDNPSEVYIPGMSPKEHFEALCATQAGEFILRKIESVDGIALLRARAEPSQTRGRHLTAFEDPATYDTHLGDAIRSLLYIGRYGFVERLRADGRFEQFVPDPDRPKDSIRLKITVLDRRTAKYGYTWRGIWNPMQLENGISGGELIVLDLDSQEVVAFKRDFRLRWLGKYPNEQRYSPSGFDVGYACPAVRAASMANKYRGVTDFLNDSLAPAAPKGSYN